MNEIEIHDEPGADPAQASGEQHEDTITQWLEEQDFLRSMGVRPCPFGHMNCRCSRPAYCGR